LLPYIPGHLVTSHTFRSSQQHEIQLSTPYKQASSKHVQFAAKPDGIAVMQNFKKNNQIELHKQILATTRSRETIRP
jgi:hypothetical protein